LRPIFALSFAAFMVASGLSSDAAPAERQKSASFDGLWSVVIVTLQGSCDRSYRYPVRIVRLPALRCLSRSGAIRVIVVRGGQWADGRGRLTDGRGAGNWTISAGQCAGQWTAVRRG
jgi:hypothetical protein